MTEQVGGDDTAFDKTTMMNLKCAELGITLPEVRGGGITSASVNLGFVLHCKCSRSASYGNEAFKASSDMRDDSVF